MPRYGQNTGTPQITQAPGIGRPPRQGYRRDRVTPDPTANGFQGLSEEDRTQMGGGGMSGMSLSGQQTVQSQGRRPHPQEQFGMTDWMNLQNQGMQNTTNQFNQTMGAMQSGYDNFLSQLQGGGGGGFGQQYDDDMMNNILGQLSQFMSLNLMSNWMPQYSQFGQPQAPTGPRLQPGDLARLGRNV